jgi:hypothetical protein
MCLSMEDPCKQYYSFVSSPTLFMFFCSARASLAFLSSVYSLMEPPVPLSLYCSATRLSMLSVDMRTHF